MALVQPSLQILPHRTLNSICLHCTSVEHPSSEMNRSTTRARTQTRENCPDLEALDKVRKLGQRGAIVRAEAHVNHDRERHLVGHPANVSTLSKTSFLSLLLPQGIGDGSGPGLLAPHML